jgi:hypothetical protein
VPLASIDVEAASATESNTSATDALKNMSLQAPPSGNVPTVAPSQKRAVRAKQRLVRVHTRVSSGSERAVQMRCELHI